jgi:hypothetical protein
MIPEKQNDMEDQGGVIAKHASKGPTKTIPFCPQVLGNVDSPFFIRVSDGNQLRNPSPQLCVGRAAMLVY